jgi:hypothetical protein
VTEGATAFEVLDALGLCRLEKRAGDLDGSVPLRVAQACVPMMEGNAFGFQVRLLRPIELRRSFGRIAAAFVEPHREAVEAAWRAALPRLLAQGFLAPGGPWHAALVAGPLRSERTGLASSRVRLWTGLLLRPDQGVLLRVSATANRRNRLVEVDEHFIAAEGAFVPLVLTLTLAPDAPERMRLEGELGTVAPLSADAQIEVVPLAEAREVGEAHAAFFDPAYFEGKKGEPTRKYRRLKTRDQPEEPGAEPRCRVVVAGPPSHRITRAGLVAGSDGVREAEAVPRVIFSNLVTFEARWDGHTMTVEPDREALAAGGRAVERAFDEALGEGFVEAHRGALWYFTKYFTPHPPGEPHFFVKPWAFFTTAPGWSSLVEGLHGDGWDALRGVVATDVFHATPAVFQVHRAGAPIRVRAGDPLIHVIPVPRRLLAAGPRTAAFRDAS